MKKNILFFLLLAAIAISCSKKNAGCGKDSFEYFNTHLTKAMTYAELVKIFEEPDEDIGSGIHVYVYQLCDATRIIIGFSDKIHYARHVDSNLQVLHTII